MHRRLPAVLTAATLALGGLALTGAPSHAATAPYTVSNLHFKVNIGPDRSQVCDVVGDLYAPTTASPTHRVPAILTTNGFGGSKDDQAGFGRAMASRGYAVLSYSGLGFGGSDCKITLDDPDYDGVAGSQLVSYLGGSTGIAYLDADHTQPAPRLDVIRLDPKDHDGVKRTNDPRVGMIGGSYGGAIQFAVASVDPRVDALIPMITWNDLSYSLDPNNTDQLAGPGNGVSTKTMGSAKLYWAAGFSAVGVENGLTAAQSDPSRLIGCPNFALWVCPGLIDAGSTGFVDDATLANLRHASVTSFMPSIKVPTLLMQGEFDTLFNLNEATATYKALKAQGTPVKMIWHSWGHSHSTHAPGEFVFGDGFDPTANYEDGRVSAWFDRYLKNADVSTGAEFAYFRDWVSYTGNAQPAFAESGTFPVGTAQKLYLGTSTLQGTAPVVAGSQSFVTPAAGAPTAYNTLDAFGDKVPVPLPEQDAPGTFATWSTAPLTANLDVVGSPSLRLTVDAPLAAASQASGPAGMLVLYARLQDVAPDGTASDIKQLTAPVRIPDVGSAFTVTMPAIVHRFAPGHSLRLVVSGGSVNYRGGLTANPVTITGGAGQVLSLPVVP